MYITIVNTYVVVFVRIFSTDGILEEAIIRVRAIIRDNTVFLYVYVCSFSTVYIRYLERIFISSEGPS